ncbi:MAG TPA: hypothetical protein VL225_05700 [Vicinamibacterales bacterium]|nr:hypothetical protein [Vicinamibacterales bacterium]
MNRVTLILCSSAVLFTSRAGPASTRVQAVRFKQNPIISPRMGHGIGDSIGNPSLIKVPTWVRHRLGRYYLYFSGHRGTAIRLAYPDHLEGPWSIYEPGALSVNDTVCVNYITAPDVHVDDERREIRLYFNGPLLDPQRAPRMRQPSLVAISKDGIHFNASSEIRRSLFPRLPFR